MSALDNLTEKQRRFVEAYLGEAAGNATQSARIAGYAGNDNTLRSQGSEVLSNPAVKAAIAELRKPRQEAAIASRDERYRFLTAVMRGEEMEARVDASGQVLAVCPLKDRLKAAETLGKAQGDFIERTEDVSSVQALLARLRQSVSREAYREVLQALASEAPQSAAEAPETVQ